MRTCTITSNRASCNCTYGCSRKGLCCECIAYHRAAGELPACYFSQEDEQSYDRSIQNYLRSR